MSLSIDTAAEHIQTDENLSPLGKRKSDTPSESCRSGKRSPLSLVKPYEAVMNSPLKAAKKGATPYSSSKFIPRVSKEEVEATDEGRASVNKLSAWLASESAKKAKKTPTIVPAPNPVRFRMKPKINKEDVEATNDKRVSVKTLSAWISDDPFEQKKLRHIRSGVHVINKSRVFEPDKKKIDVQVEAGSVHEKQAWLSCAFKHEDGMPPIMHKEKVPVPRAYQNKPKPESPDKSLMSVSEKKQWLNNAFKTNDNGIHPSKSFDSMAAGPGILTCTSVDDAKQECELPAITQRASFDGVSTSCKSPVRLYKKTEVQVETTESRLKTVHDKQEWLANVFKPQRTPEKVSTVCQVKEVKVEATSTVCQVKEVKVEATPIASSCEKIKETKPHGSGKEKEEQQSEDVVSVADRAKWLRGAFNKN